MTEMGQKQLALLAKQFADSQFGRLFIETFRQASADYVTTAKNTATTFEHKALIIERAAGVDEPLDWIDALVALADNPELSKEEAKPEVEG